jgi:hypothetical protein
MKKTGVKKTGIILLMLGLLTAGCNLPSSDQDISVDDWIATYEQQTLVAAGGDAGPDGGGEASGATATQTIEPTLTLTPSSTLTPTESKPMISVSVDTNCRTGPGKIYDWIGALLVGEEAEVVGQSGNGEYWVVNNPDQAGECWLWANYASVTGPTANLPVYTPPPTPTPIIQWQGSWTTYNVAQDSSWHYSYPMTLTVSGSMLTGVVDLGGGDTANLSGTISEDYATVSGSWTSSGLSGTFEFFALGPNQFKGNGDNGSQIFGWCGSRSGAGEPSPCYSP